MHLGTRLCIMRDALFLPSCLFFFCYFFSCVAAGGPVGWVGGRVLIGGRWERVVGGRGECDWWGGAAGEGGGRGSSERPTTYSFQYFHSMATKHSIARLMIRQPPASLWIKRVA